MSKLFRTPGARRKPKICATALKNALSLKKDIDVSRKRKRKSSSGSYELSEQMTTLLPSPVDDVQDDVQYVLLNNDLEKGEFQDHSSPGYDDHAEEGSNVSDLESCGFQESISHSSPGYDDHAAEDSTVSNDDDYTVFSEQANNWTDVDDLLGDQPVENLQSHCGHHFSSYTHAAFSIFLAVFRLSRRSYSTLIQIIQHPNFSVSDIPSYSQAKRLLREVRTIPTHVHYRLGRLIPPKEPPR